jgi:hypothetical protein
MAAHLLHSLVGRNQSSSKFCVNSEMFFNMEFYYLDVVTCILLQKPLPLQRQVYKILVSVTTTDISNNSSSLQNPNNLTYKQNHY